MIEILLMSTYQYPFDSVLQEILTPQYNKQNWVIYCILYIKITHFLSTHIKNVRAKKSHCHIRQQLLEIDNSLLLIVFIMLVASEYT
jgi:hypothetical protein